MPHRILHDKNQSLAPFTWVVMKAKRQDELTQISMRGKFAEQIWTQYLLAN